MKILAIDYGIARTGVATCDPLETIASPLCVIPSYNHEKLIAELLRVIKESGAQKLIIGKPLRTDGNKSEMAEKCEAFAAELRELTGMDVESVDERFTTVIASQHLHANRIAKYQGLPFGSPFSSVCFMRFWISCCWKQLRKAPPQQPQPPL